jgi:acyl-CoA thioesterase FadM
METSGPMSSISFETPPMRVYIEDTDAYGIMYNTNYLRSYDRALHLTTINRNLNTLVTSQHEGWAIVSMGHQKFASSPALGGDFVVQATLKESADNWEIWDMQMTSPDGATLYNKVIDLQIAKPTSNSKVNGNIFSLKHIEAFSFDDGLPKSVDTFTIYRDEIDAHWTGHLPLRNVLNLFERARTNRFGGPDDLRRLQQEDGILVVVIGIGECSLIDEGVFCCPGQQVDVETASVVKRRGMIVECWQTLKSGTSRLAQGKVDLMMLDAKTRRPTSKLPTWAQEKLGLMR